MAIALNVDIFDADGRVIVRHVFFGEDEAEAEELKQAHLKACSEFRAADAEGRTGEFTEDIDDEDVPTEADYEEEEEEAEDE
jgi:hypothetical protein